MTKSEFANIAGILTAVWEINFDDMTIQVWYAALKDLGYKRIELAVQKLAVTEKNRITPAHIRNAYDEIETARKDSVDMLMIINNAIAGYGRYRALEALEYIKKQDEAAYTIIRALGFLNVCDSKPSFLKPQLEKLYKEFTENVRNQNVLPEKLRFELAELRNTLVENSLALKAGDEYD